MLLSDEERAFLETARRAVLGTTRADGRARLVPVCFVVTETNGGTLIHSPLDEKPKRSADPRDLGRVRDVLARPLVSLLVDRWDEDWTKLAWLRLDGRARLVEPGGDGHGPAIGMLRARYPQYERHDLGHRPLLAIEVTAAASWPRPRQPGKG